MKEKYRGCMVAAKLMVEVNGVARPHGSEAAK